MDEEKAPAIAGHVIGSSLERLSVSELKGLIDQLERERERVEAEIAAKQSQAAAADRLFGKSG